MKLTKIDAITLFVADPRRSAEFYERVFDVGPIYQDNDSVAFKFEGAVINLLGQSAVPELIAPAEMALPDTGATDQITVEVEDVDQACVELAAKGIVLLNGPMDRPWGIRTASFVDPDGHIWEVAASLKKS